MTILDHYVAALSITAFTLFAVGIFTYLKNRKGKVNQAFAIFVLSVAVWSFGEAQLIISSNEFAALFLARLGYSGIIFIAPTFAHFVFAFLGITGKKRRIVLTSFYLFAAISLILNFTNLLTPQPVPKFSFNYYWESSGVIFPYQFIVWWVIVMYGLFELFRAYSAATGARWNQIKYVFFGALIGYLGGASNYLLFFNIEMYPYSPFGTYGVAIFSIMIAYAIYKYRLMDVNIVFGKLAAYSALLLTIGGVGLGLMTGADRIFSGAVNYNPLLSHFLIFLMISLGLIYFVPHMKTKAEEGIERAFFKNKYRYRKALREFNKKLTFIPQEGQLLNETVENIANLMGVSRVAVILLDDISGNYVIKAQRGLEGKDNQEVFTTEDRTIKWLGEHKKVLLAEEMGKILWPGEVEKIKSELEKIEAGLCLPLMIKDKLAGVLALGEKHSREMFSSPDIELLESLSVQLALAITYKRLENQMVRANRMVSLGTLAAGMAHEIRNPLSSIQTFAQLLPEKYDDREFREEFSKIVSADTQRINRLIESVMSLASPRPPEAVPCSVNELLNEALFLIEGKIKKQGTEIIRNYDQKISLIRVDREQIEQVFLNIFLNALSVLPEGTGKLTVTTRSKFISSIFTSDQGNYVQAEITDNGPGMEKRLLERIFEPFFTTRAEGTGLGMALAHRIIEQHKGFIKVDSAIGKGTTFLINLPSLEEKDD